MKTVSCIIPAYNEEHRIANVLSALADHPLIAEVLIIDDGSKDLTAKVVELAIAGHTNMRLLRQEVNRGKSAAIARGIRESTGELLLFVDSDLLNLTAEDLSKLIEPVTNGSADISMSLRRNAPRAWHWIGIDYISGERVIPRSMLLPLVPAIETLAGFGLEVFLNKAIIESNYRVAVVLWPLVDSPYKMSKDGFWKGIKGDTRMMKEIFKTIGMLGALKQISSMRRLRVLQ